MTDRLTGPHILKYILASELQMEDIYVICKRSLSVSIGRTAVTLLFAAAFLVSLDSCSTTADRKSKILPLEGADIPRGELRIVVKNFRNQKGRLNLILVPEFFKDTFPGDLNESYASFVIPANIENETVTFIVPDLPHGRYAVAVMHDMNMNGKLDYVLYTPLLWGPREAFGFSTTKSLFPAGFDSAAFDFKTSSMSVDVELSNFWSYAFWPFLIISVAGAGL